jgi:LysM repeat protein
MIFKKRTALLSCILLFLFAGKRCIAKHELSAGIRTIYVHRRCTQPNNRLLNERNEFLHRKKALKNLPLNSLLYSRRGLGRSKKKFFKGLRNYNSYRTIIDKRQSVPADSTIVHTVKKGETLYSIANEYGVSVASLKQWNHLTNNAIQVGEKLNIHPKEAHQTTSVSRKTKKNDRPSNKDEYTVKSGDTLFRIAQMFEVSVKELKKLNHLASNTIKVGQRLKIRSGSASVKKNSSMKYGKFTRIRIKKNQPIDSILAKFQMEKNEFRALNPGIDFTSLLKGEQIEVLLPARISQKNPYRAKNTSKKKIGTILASEYKSGAFGPTTNGELYNPDALTAGSADIKIGTVLFLKNTGSGRGVFVRINDRTQGKGLKLSSAAWNALQLTATNRKVLTYRVHE